MSTTLIYTLKSLLLPPGGLILLGLLGLALSRRRLGRTLIFLSLLGLYGLSTPYLSGQLMSGLERYPALSVAAAERSGAEAIVVLGSGRYLDAPEYGGDSIRSLHLERLRYAAWLARRTGLPIIPSGGIVLTEGAPEAWLAREILTDEFGVQVAAVEDVSRNTRENARLTRVVLEQLGIDRVLLVTHAWHMPRAMEAMRRAGVNAQPAPTSFQHKNGGEAHLLDWLPSANAFLVSYWAIHEYAGRLWYRATAK